MTIFEPFKYFTDPIYPATVEFRLTSTTLANPPANDLSAYTELAGKGYKRITGERDHLFRGVETTPESIVADSKRLAWFWRNPAPQTVSAVLMVATFPGEAPQLVRVFPVSFTLENGGPALAFSCAICAERVEF